MQKRLEPAGEPSRGAIEQAPEALDQIRRSGGPLRAGAPGRAEELEPLWSPRGCLPLGCGGGVAGDGDRGREGLGGLGRGQL
jgi:hypothetical protein